MVDVGSGNLATSNFKVDSVSAFTGTEIAFSNTTTFSSNVSMAGVNNMLSFKTFGSRQIAGGISTTTAVTASEYTDYTASTATNATNIDFIKTNEPDNQNDKTKKG